MRKKRAKKNQQSKPCDSNPLTSLATVLNLITALINLICAMMKK